MYYYYSLKFIHPVDNTEREYCFEPLLYGGAYFAIYTDGELSIKKQKVDEPYLKDSMRYVEMWLEKKGITEKFKKVNIK